MTRDLSTPELRGPVALLVQGLLALTALSALAAATLAGLHAHWFTLGFEAVLLGATVLGMLAASGRPPYGQPLGLTCVAGAIAVGSFLESVGVDRAFLGLLGRRLATIPAPAVTIHLDVLLLFRFGVAGLLALIAGLVLIRRNPAPSVRRLLIGLALAAAALALLAGAWLGRGAINSLAAPIKWGLALIGFLVVTGLIAAATQHLIRAFSARRA